MTIKKAATNTPRIILEKRKKTKIHTCQEWLRKTFGPNEYIINNALDCMGAESLADQMFIDKYNSSFVELVSFNEMVEIFKGLQNNRGWMRSQT